MKRVIYTLVMALSLGLAGDAFAYKAPVNTKAKRDSAARAGQRSRFYNSWRRRRANDSALNRARYQRILRLNRDRKERLHRLNRERINHNNRLNREWRARLRG